MVQVIYWNNFRFTSITEEGCREDLPVVIWVSLLNVHWMEFLLSMCLGQLCQNSALLGLAVGLCTFCILFCCALYAVRVFLISLPTILCTQAPD